MADWGNAQHANRAHELQTGAQVIGRVLDGLTGRGIGCAQVTLMGVDAMTDEAGRFAYGSVPAGPFTISAVVDGYGDGVAAGVATPGVESAVDILVTPTAAGAIQGQVVDAISLDPLAGAVVKLDMGRSTSTDAEGRFTFNLVGPGAHTLEASAPGHRSETLAVVVAVGSVFNSTIGLQPGTGQPPAARGFPVLGALIAAGIGVFVLREITKD